MMNDPPAAHPKRRSWNLSLRGLMVLVLVVGGVMGWQARRVSIQRRAVGAIQAAGGRIAYDYQFSPHGGFQLGASPQTPRWVREVLGDDLFRKVFLVACGGPGQEPPELPAASLALLSDLDQLHRLNLWGVPLRSPMMARLPTLTNLEEFELLLIGHEPGQLADVPPLGTLKRLKSFRICPSPEDDAGLAFLRGLDGLTTVDLRETRATDAGLAVLATLPRLYSVQLDGSKVTDAGLAHLGRIRPLTTLDLRTPGRSALYTDRGLVHLARIPHLTCLSLDATPITARGFGVFQFHSFHEVRLTGLRPDHEDLVRLVAKRSLNTLGLSGPGVTDDWLRSLPIVMGQLDTLSLNDTKVTDAGMDSIIHHPQLRWLELDATTLTDEGLAKLVAAPGLKIISAMGTKVTPNGVKAFRAVRPTVDVRVGPLPPR